MRAVSELSSTPPGAEAVLCTGAMYLPGEVGGTDYAMRGGNERRSFLYVRLLTYFSNLVVFYHYASSRKLSRQPDGSIASGSVQSIT